VLISVITAVRNEVGSILSTLRSVSVQSWESLRLEHILVDGVSTDGTSDAVQGFISKNTSAGGVSYGYVREPDNGIYDAMNKGLAMAKGDFSLFLNAGDLFHDADVLSRVSAYIGQHGDINGVYFGQVLIQSEWARWTRPAFINKSSPVPLAAPRDVPHHQSVFYPRSFYARERYDPKLIKYGDTDYSLRAVENHQLYAMPLIVTDVTLGGFSTRRHSWRQAMEISKDFARLATKHHRYYGKRDILKSRVSFALKWMLDSVFGSKAKHLAMRIARRRSSVA
jgi:glycosyltransferase involved in cell wall biosynthesis